MELQKQNNDDLMQMMKTLGARVDGLEGKAKGLGTVPNVSIHDQAGHTEPVKQPIISEDFLRIP